MLPTLRLLTLHVNPSSPQAAVSDTTGDFGLLRNITVVPYTAAANKISAGLGQPIRLRICLDADGARAVE